MRQYIVQPGDSPAGIASRPEMAGCPKCSVDLIAANPSKETIRYSNGFVTFKSLRVGEVLNLPDKWFNGTLDRMPRSYFDGLPNLPQAPQRSAHLGLGANPMLNPCDGYAFTVTGGAGSTGPDFSGTPTLSGPGGTGGPSCFTTGTNMMSCAGVNTYALGPIALPTSFPDLDPSKPSWTVSAPSSTPAAAGASILTTPPCKVLAQPTPPIPPTPPGAYVIPPGATYQMTVLPGLVIGAGNPGVDASKVAQSIGLDVSGGALVHKDCSVTLKGSNLGSAPITVGDLIVSSYGDMWLGSILVNGAPLKPVLISMQMGINGTLKKCRQFGMSFKYGDCTNCLNPAQSNTCRDPTAALKAAGFTKYQLLPSPDPHGNLYIVGVWEKPDKTFAGTLGSGSNALFVTGFQVGAMDLICTGAGVSLQCAANKVRDSHGNCVCKSGYSTDAHGNCVLTTGGSGGGGGGGVQTPAASNTGTIVAVGAGALVIVGGIALAMSSKKRR